MTQTPIEALPATRLANPYVGPQSFSRREHRFFKGRERETSELGDLLAARRLVLFYAESGAGKTSLLNAGLAPLLEKREFEVLPVARVAGSAPEGITPSNLYAFNVIAAIDRNPQSAGRFTGLELTDFLLDLEQVDSRFLYNTAADAAIADAAIADDIPRRVLVIDQFEELFITQAGPGNQSMREDFMRQIARAMADDPYLYVLLSMRADYVHHLSRYVHLLPEGLHTRYYMSRMRPEDALRAVAEPARAAGRPFDKGVAEELVERLARERNQTPGGDGEEWTRGETVEPVQLQVVCFQLWESVAQSNNNARIGREDLNRVARSMLPEGVEAADPLSTFIDSALGSFYEQTLAEALRVPDAKVGEQFLRNWFSQELITPAGTRGFVLRGQTETAGVPEAVLAVLLTRLLVRSETRAGGRWVELVHDTFIAPVRQANDTWLQRQMRETPWIAAAYRWAERGRPANELLAGELLETALKEAGDPAGHAEIVRDFLMAGVKAETERKEAEEEARVAVARQLARAREVRRFAYILGALSVLALMAAVAAGFFAVQAQEEGESARSAEAQAVAAQVTAEFNASVALDAGATAEALRATSAFNEQVARLTEATAVAAQATSAVNERAAREAQANVERLNRETRVRLLAAEAENRLAHDPEAALLLAAAAYQATNLSEGTTTGEAVAAFYHSLDSPYRTRLVGHEGSVNSAAFSPDGTRVVTASDDGTARLWDAAGGETLAELVGHAGQVTSAAFSPDGMRVVTASVDGTARLWDAAGGETLAELVGHTNSVRSAALSPDGTRVVTASNDGTARLWDAAGGETLAELVGHTNVVSSAAFSPAGTRVVTASGDGTARVWDAASGETLAELVGHTSFFVTSAAFSPDGTRVVTASGDGTARVWDAASGETLAELVGHEDWVWFAAFSPDGTRVVTASNDGTARLWDAAGGATLAELVGHAGSVLSAAFSPDGTRVVTASNDGTARLWDAAGGATLAELVGHGGAVTSAVFSPDGTRVVTASNDGTARLWDAASGATLAELVGHEDWVTSAVFSPDGTRVVTASVDGTARIWALHPVDLLSEAQRRYWREPTDIIPDFCERYFQDAADECPATLAQLFPAEN